MEGNLPPPVVSLVKPVAYNGWLARRPPASRVGAPSSTRALKCIILSVGIARLPQFAMTNGKTRYLPQLIVSRSFFPEILLSGESLR